MVLWQNNQMFNTNGKANDDIPLNRGAKIALLGSAISTLGDALQTIGGAISIEEDLISDAQQQQTIDKLQSQIDELKKQQSPNSTDSSDVEKLGKLLERLIERLEKDDSKKT